MPDFGDFLEAKFALDERSLARDVRGAWLAMLQRDALRCLDIGTGTGAMVRRLLDAVPAASSIEVVALDRDSGILARARASMRAHLSRRGFEQHDEADGIEAHDARRRVHLRFACSDILQFEPQPGDRYDLVTAHAFMDLVPMRPLLERIAGWLSPGGLFYATLNYDGETVLLPPHADAAFEESLLARYDASMEERRVEGSPTGGARSGRRLHALLDEAGFEILACASSDWNAVPHHGRLRDGDAVVLSVLLDALRRECEPHVDRARLAAWYDERRALLAAGRLGAIVHQIDLLAVAPSRRADALPDTPGGLTAFT